MFLVAACGGSRVNPDDATVEEHRRLAEAEDAKARGDLGAHARVEHTPEGDAARVSRGAFDPGGELTYPEKTYDPSQYRVDEAQRHSAHALAHEQAAAELERFEDAECKMFPPKTGTMCPILGPAVGTVDIAGGVRVTLQPGVPVRAVVDHMRCHLAYARAHGYADDCPLYMKGVKIDATPDGTAITITTTNSADVAELRARARRQIVQGKPTT
jgi:hypothetical protein